MSDQGLRHSFLAIAYSLWKRDMVRAMVHENATIKYLEDQFELVGKFSGHERADHVRKLARSVTRLAIIKVCIEARTSFQLI